MSAMDFTERRRVDTLTVDVGGIPIGGDNPVVIQEMTSTRPSDIQNTISQIESLKKAGCRLIRLAVPDEASAKAIRVLKRNTGVALVADIHFDYRLALLALDNGADKLRINPGTIGSDLKVREVVAAARAHGVPIRVGVNSGSLQSDIREKHGGVSAGGLVESALREVRLLERNGFDRIVISIKATDIELTIQANKLLAAQVEYPLHIGITESGFGEEGIMRSVVGLGTLLLNGIGDTVRVSLTHKDRSENITVCRGILESLNIPFC